MAYSDIVNLIIYYDSKSLTRHYTSHIQVSTTELLVFS
jgi:hypothetical protein